MRVKEAEAGDDVRARTYRSFGFEWHSFSEQIPAYRQNFLWYLEPLAAPCLRGLLVLDAGCGMGRHTYHFLQEGARVVALDASRAIEVAARNSEGRAAAFVQGDLLHLPVAPAQFDLVCCLGVLHHLEHTEQALAQLVAAARPGGSVLVYLYHDPSEASPWQGTILRAVSALRVLTTRMPLRLLRVLSWLLAASLLVGYIGPAKTLSRVTRLRPRLRALPLGQYQDYPFRVLWNDQFDRFSAPLEKRYRRSEVESLLRRAGLGEIRIFGGHGWRAAGRKPA